MPIKNRHRTKLTPKKEVQFKRWYKNLASRLGIDFDPDHPKHFYDYRGAYKAGSQADSTGHLPSKFKDFDHPNRYVQKEGTILDTKTGKAVNKFHTALPDKTKVNKKMYTIDTREMKSLPASTKETTKVKYKKKKKGKIKNSNPVAVFGQKGSNAY